MNQPTQQEIQSAAHIARTDLLFAHRACDSARIEAAHKRLRDIEDAIALIEKGLDLRASAKGIRIESDSPHPEGADRRDRLRAEADFKDREAVAYLLRARILIGLS
jgi:hypothetical protein